MVRRHLERARSLYAELLGLAFSAVVLSVLISVGFGVSAIDVLPFAVAGLAWALLLFRLVVTLQRGEGAETAETAEADERSRELANLVEELEPADYERVTRALDRFEDPETLTEEELLAALRERQIDLVELVEEGTLAFFLPLDAPQETVDRIRVNEGVAVQYLDDRSLKGVADRENVLQLAWGLGEIDGIDDSHRLAEDIQEEAERWQRVLSGADLRSEN